MGEDTLIPVPIPVPVPSPAPSPVLSPAPGPVPGPVLGPVPGPVLIPGPVTVFIATTTPTPPHRLGRQIFAILQTWQLRVVLQHVHPLYGLRSPSLAVVGIGLVEARGTKWHLAQCSRNHIVVSFRRNLGS